MPSDVALSENGEELSGVDRDPMSFGLRSNKHPRSTLPSDGVVWDQNGLIARFSNLAEAGAFLKRQNILDERLI